MCACDVASVELVRLLLSRGSSPNAHKGNPTDMRSLEVWGMELWNLGLGRYGTWGCESMGEWECGGMELGCVKVWENGNVEVWSLGV